ncbi:amidohydrolase family protein [Hyphococcus flavus]|uniref:Amidohydrolase family protein n=1 Tax=Hyphococcus flavus TaxID=1866326 RepID=A0AAE9ZG32_9PROT|nr:amidohydrolase family protein [Hyphococcus flavus]WDI30201.1 amidohydrolase family protein [Hyphococcus flavus]
MTTMRCLFAALIVLIGCDQSLPATGKDALPVAQTHFVNGFWFEAGRFIERDMYAGSGVFTEPPASGSSLHVVDLNGAYVVPPFAEAHHHMVLCEPGRIEQFIEAGIFYAQILNARVTQKSCEEEMHSDFGAPEIANAYAGLTASDAHPSQIGEYFLSPEAIDGEWVHYIDSLSDLEEKWPAIEAMDGDILKIFLSYSEDFEFLQGNTDVSSWYKGLNPALVPAVVEKAHSSGLRVSAHVMSAQDFHVAVSAGVDQIAHMPGFAPGPSLTMAFDNPWLLSLLDDAARYQISREDAESAAQSGIDVVTTLSGMDEILADPDGFARQLNGSEAPSIAAAETAQRFISVWQAAARHNMEVLKDSGVTILIGSDRGEFNSIDEYLFLIDQGLMTASDALYSLSVATPKAIFPDRRIGELTPGAEASFVALNGNPLIDMSAIRSLDIMYKKGQRIE